MMHFSLLKVVLPLLLIFAAKNSYTQETENVYYVSNGCDNSSKIDLLIRKGIMTKNLCLRAHKNKLEVILQGQSFSLGQYFKNNELNNFYNKAAKGTLTCNKQAFKGERAAIAEDYFSLKNEEMNYLDQIAKGKFPKAEFERLRDFLHDYQIRINDLKKVSESVEYDGADSVSIKAYGYADGVKNNDTNYDSYIYNQLCNAGDNSQLRRLILKNIPDAKADPFSYFNNSLDKPVAQQSNASKVRNVFLGKMRADNLRDQVLSIIQGPSGISNIQKIPSDSEISETGDDRLNPDFQSNCVGYCQMRRGAKLDITIPGIKDQMTSIDPLENEISAYYNSPYAKDQLLMNKFAMRTLLKDFMGFLNDKSNETDEVIKKAKEIERKELLQVFAKTKSKSSTEGKNNFVPAWSTFECDGPNAPRCGTEAEENQMLNKFFKEKYINLIKFAALQVNPDALRTKSSVTHYKQGIAEILPAAYIGKSNLAQDIFNAYVKYNQLGAGFIKAMNKVNGKASKKIFADIRSEWAEKEKVQYIKSNPQMLNYIIWGNHRSEKIDKSFYSELKTQFSPNFMTGGALSFDKLKQNYSEIIKHNTGVTYLGEYLINSEADLKFEGLIFKHFRIYKCTKSYLQGSPIQSDECKAINKGLKNSHHTKESLADYDFLDPGAYDLSAVVYYPFASKKTDASSLDDGSFSYATKVLGGKNWEIKKNSELSPNYSNHKKIANPYFFQANALIKDFWNTSISLSSLPRSLTTYFLKNKFNIPKNGQIKIQNNVAGVDKTVTFEKYFDELIDWTTLIIRNSIKDVSGDDSNITITPRALAELNYNSETKSNLMNKAGNLNYPLILLPERMHKRALRDVYTAAYISGHSQMIYGALNRQINDTTTKAIYNEYLENYSESKYLGKYGTVTKSTYDRYKKIIDDELKNHSITDVKTVNWPKSDSGVEIEEVHFIGNNWKAITELMSLYLLKAQKLEKVNYSASSFDNYNNMRPAFIDKFSPAFIDKFKGEKGETREILEYLHRVNVKFITAHIEEFPEINNFKTISENYGSIGPRNSKMGAQVSTIFSFADYTGAYADILRQLTESDKKPKDATKVSEGNWSKWWNYKYMLKPVPKNLKYVYYRPTDIHVGGDVGVRGFLHTACHTGVLFPDDYNNKPNTRFHYQSRYKTPRGQGYRDYPSLQKYRYQYDDSYYIPQNDNLTITPLTLIKVKNPTSYLVYGDNGCKSCNCLRNKALTEDKLRTWLENSIELQFTSEFKWKSNDMVGQYAEKRYVVANDAQNKAGDLVKPFKRNFTTGGKRNVTLEHPSEEYCLFSPIVPQSHEVGTGASDGQDDNVSVEKQLVAINACPFVDALNGVPGQKIGDITINELDGLDDVVLDKAEFDDIKQTCNAAIDSFPMEKVACNKIPADPKLKNTFDACSFMPQSIAKKFGTEKNGKYTCYKDADDSLIVEGQKEIPIMHNNQMVGNYKAYLCDAITKVFDEDKNKPKDYPEKGYMIWTKKKIKDGGKIKLTNP